MPVLLGAYYAVTGALTLYDTYQAYEDGGLKDAALQLAVDGTLSAVGGRIGAKVLDNAIDTAGDAARRLDEVTNSGPDGRTFPNRPLPRDQHGNPVPETDAPHTQLGTRSGRNGDYPQAREFDANGNPVRDIDFTNHGRADHLKPHQHRYSPNETGGTPRRGPTEPLQYP